MSALVWSGSPLPRLLSEVATPAALRTPWPIAFLLEGSGPERMVPLTELLEGTAGTGPLLRDNLLRLEQHARALLEGKDAPVAAAPLIEAAGAQMREALHLKPAPDASLGEELQALVAALPKGATLLGYGPKARLWLLQHLVGPLRDKARQAWRDRVHEARNGISALLEVERARDPEGPAGVAASMGAIGDSLVNPAALARVVGPARGGRRMAVARREHLAQLLTDLEAELQTPDAPTLILLGESLDAPGVQSNPSRDPCADASARFDALAGDLCRAVATWRAARLELAQAWDGARHPAALAALDWWHLDEEDLHRLPLIAACESADRLVREDLVPLTRALGSGRPIQVLVEVQATRNPGNDGPLDGFRVELGQLGMSLRQAVVNQSTAAAPDHCLEGFQRAASRLRPGLHLLVSGYFPGGSAPSVGAWMAASSAVESRAHPLFLDDPAGGESWADCLDASSNPEPETDWTGGEPGAADGDGEVAPPYTFADHALLDPLLAPHTRAPEEAEAARLMPVSAWLALDPTDAARFLPTIAVIDDGRPAPLVVSEALAFATRDRLRAWRSLRELAGYGNAHAKRAAALARAEALEEATKEREALEAAHARSLEEVRSAAAREAMGRLAAMLMNTDWTAGPTPTARPATPAPAVAKEAVAAPVAEAEAPAPPPPAAAPEVEEPWIDSALCTSCNDCINLNGQLFKYDANKQALINDMHAGSFEELVRAAEGCPARCIHPGTPLNAAEPGLDALVQRAVRFR